MITSPAFAGKRYAVLGLARSGLATVEALLASAAEVVAWDDREEARAQILPRGGRRTAQGAVEGNSGWANRVTRCPSTAFGGPPPPPGEESR